MSRFSGAPRWDLWLGLVALVAAALMTVLAFATQRTMGQRNALVLEGRLLGLAHDAETRLRETGIQQATAVLTELLPQGGAAVRGLVLLSSDDQQVAAHGDLASANVRALELFLGRFAAEGSGFQRHPGSGRLGPAARGRGRFVLKLYLDPQAGKLPLVARLLLPVTAVVGVALIWLAVLGGRLLIRQRDALQQTEERRRLEALARAGAGLAHQLRTPLATIKGTCQLLGESGAAVASPAKLESVIAQADRMDRLLGRLLDYARPAHPEPTAVALAPVLSEVVAPYPVATIQVPDGVTAFVDRQDLVEILDNLLTNAVFFSPQEASVVLSVKELDTLTQITVADRGPGPGEEPERLFEPYVSSRVDGTGLGLAIARNLALTNHGSLTLKERPSGGCAAVLTLPRTEHS